MTTELAMLSLIEAIHKRYNFKNWDEFCYYISEENQRKFEIYNTELTITFLYKHLEAIISDFVKNFAKRNLEI
ncbi:MAG: hypothetical protein QXJ92_00875 [Candidatus Pacearchaeota archaeon]